VHDAPAMARDVDLAITAGEVTLSATLTLPDATGGEDRWPAALLLPSSLPRDRDGRFDRDGHPGWFALPTETEDGLLARLATALAARGVASLRYDKRGCGLSGGEWATAGLFTLVDDARDAMAVLRGHAEIDPSRIGIIGHGEGAWLGLSVAAADPAVGPLTTVASPARGHRDVLRRGLAERARQRGQTGSNEHPFVAALDRGLEELIERAQRGEAEMILTLPGGDRVRLGLAGWEQAMQIPTRALATLQQRSVTVVHGARDAWVDPEEADLLAAVLESTSSPRRIVVPHAGHDLEEAPPDLFRDLAADLAARLQPRRLPTVLLSIGLR
jgi:uncharacterized protein